MPIFKLQEKCIHIVRKEEEVHTYVSLDSEDGVVHPTHQRIALCNMCTGWLRGRMSRLLEFGIAGADP